MMTVKPGSGHSILVVEDTPSNMSLLRDLLNEYGFTILEASNGEIAINILREHIPDLIIMDISLKGINGLELTKIIKGNSETRNIPVVTITAHAMIYDRSEAHKAGCDGYIVKPINTRTLPHQLLSFIK
jgi:CheY-like chemotaxis protein